MSESIENAAFQVAANTGARYMGMSYRNENSAYLFTFEYAGEVKSFRVAYDHAADVGRIETELRRVFPVLTPSLSLDATVTVGALQEAVIKTLDATELAADDERLPEKKTAKKK